MYADFDRGNSSYGHSYMYLLYRFYEISKKKYAESRSFCLISCIFFIIPTPVCKSSLAPCLEVIMKLV